VDKIKSFFFIMFLAIYRAECIFESPIAEGVELRATACFLKLQMPALPALQTCGQDGPGSTP